ncbi:2-aminoethylphosphonate aminotransferase [Caedibacter taeniospiralis]|uniref:2-aminoethylphosphonate aminotransferase n=1 Tax=Caedibacter taeniospiralis TaxID=28907 RepID=UPI000C27DBD6|nr:2-aminoethylphosphonate--pyruvate transaminase [Caedibacter taeniospiralis]
MSKQARLFTPGPLNTSQQVKASMQIDLGSRTETLADLTQNIRNELESIAECGKECTSVLLQGSGTFAVEAMLSTLIQADDCVLVISNGVYGDRMAKICQIHGLPFFVLQQDPAAPIQLDEVEKFLKNEPCITHIGVVQFETAVGILNNIDALLVLAEQHACKVLVDAMSSFGALPLPYQSTALVAVVSSANKCLHGVPGLAFVLVRLESLLRSRVTRSLSLDLKAQWKSFEDQHQWRFTPPTHCLLAFQQALLEFKQAGGMQARLKKYQALNEQLIAGLEQLGIYPAIPESYRVPMITTFLLKNIKINFNDLYTALFEQGLVIYPSSFLAEKSFRVGCIGELDARDIERLVSAIKQVLLQNEK